MLSVYMHTAASNLSVGFVTNNGTAVTNYISTGASTLFPQGAYCVYPSHPHNARALTLRSAHAQVSSTSSRTWAASPPCTPSPTTAKTPARRCTPPCGQLCMPMGNGPHVLTAQRPSQVVGPALAKLPVFGASLGLSANSSNSLLRGVPATAFVDASDPACAARCKVSAAAPTAVGGR